MVEQIEADEFALEGRRTNNEGLAVDFSNVGSPSLKVCVGSYWHTFESPEEARVFMAKLEEEIEAFESVQNE